VTLPFKKTFSLITVFFLIQIICAQVPKADKKFNLGEYQAALEIYKKPLKNEGKTLTQYRYLRIGDCYRYLETPAKAKHNYTKALELDQFPDYIYYLHFGDVLMQTENYLEAKKYLTLYLKKNPEDQLGKAKLNSCELLPFFVNQIAEFKFYSVSRINTPGREFAPTLYADGFIFVSTALKEGINAKFSESVIEDQPAYYYSKMGAEGWKPDDPKLIFENIFFSNFEKGPLSIDRQNQIVWFSKDTEDDGKIKKSTAKGKIYYSKLEGLKCKELKPFEKNHDNYSVIHPAISSDGRKLYFVSDMPGGLGQTDIYVSELTEEGWGEPKNLGKKVNTPGRELFPFVDQNDNLYFSSDGRVGYGGLDIYYAKITADTIEFCHPLKKPFNSSADDFAITVAEDDKSGYLSSKRSGGKGKEDIYYFTLDETSDLESINEVLVSNSYIPDNFGQVVYRKRVSNISITAETLNDKDDRNEQAILSNDITRMEAAPVPVLAETGKSTAPIETPKSESITELTIKDDEPTEGNLFGMLSTEKEQIFEVSLQDTLKQDNLSNNLNLEFPSFDNQQTVEIFKQDSLKKNNLTNNSDLKIPSFDTQQTVEIFIQDTLKQDNLSNNLDLEIPSFDNQQTVEISKQDSLKQDNLTNNSDLKIPSFDTQQTVEIFIQDTLKQDNLSNNLSLEIPSFDNQQTVEISKQDSLKQDNLTNNSDLKIPSFDNQQKLESSDKESNQEKVENNLIPEDQILVKEISKEILDAADQSEENVDGAVQIELVKHGNNAEKLENSDKKIIPESPLPGAAVNDEDRKFRDKEVYRKILTEFGDFSMDGLSYSIDIESFQPENKNLANRSTIGNFKTFIEAEGFRIRFEKDFELEDTYVAAKYFDQTMRVDEFFIPCDPKIAYELSKEFSVIDLSVHENYQLFIRKCGKYYCDNVVFTVQIGAFKFPESFKFKYKKEFGNPESKLGEDGLTRFTLGRFKTVVEAEEFRVKLISKGFKGSWITAIYKNGDRKLLDEVVKSSFFIDK
jgi:hypothetical protein